ncbi:hypothetical protein FSP39_018338 [Pinctada imbricata]|uniref:Zinc finger CCCH domain-containing protein 14 n=1 Tax=Pinctada imbricata TaxID=66713 RepID=A0AA89C3S6_PINIB|nr:hypothetical protein FSP39_018338 [Pinctada imbricata]
MLYIDDELPDYIMVMVANKKPRSQMNDDLGLFLNINTEKFTVWLYNLLEKLQSLGSDEEEDGEELPSTIAKSTEKCRFWPACINGNACPYVHPTQPCKMFPHCKFGDKCLYIHPNCKFDSKCTRKDCPFTHASKRSNLTTVIQKIVQVPVPSPLVGGLVGSFPQQSKSSGICRFYPNCTNMNCTFIHPMPCKFGISCLNKNQCKFYHAPLPTKDKLTWTAAGK